MVVPIFSILGVLFAIGFVVVRVKFKSASHVASRSILGSFILTFGLLVFTCVGVIIFAIQYEG